MKSELNSIIKEIKNNCGIDFDVYFKDGDIAASTRSNVKRIIPPRGNFSVPKSEKTLGATFFDFRYRGADFVGAITGAGEAEKKLAALIAAFIENAQTREEYASKKEFVLNMLSGDVPKTRVKKYIKIFLLPTSKCFALFIETPTKKTDEVLAFLETCNANMSDEVVALDAGVLGFVKFVDIDESATEGEFAQILARAVYEETGVEITIGVGGVYGGFGEIILSMREAEAAFKIGQIFSPNKRVRIYKEYILVKILSDVPRHKLIEYLDTLSAEARALLTDSDLMNTAEEFLNNDLNVSETARKLFMHRNTLMYRLDKIEKMTGLDIRNFSAAASFRLIAVISKLARGDKI